VKRAPKPDLGWRPSAACGVPAEIAGTPTNCSGAHTDLFSNTCLSLCAGFSVSVCRSALVHRSSASIPCGKSLSMLRWFDWTGPALKQELRPRVRCLLLGWTQRSLQQQRLGRAAAERCRARQPRSPPGPIPTGPENPDADQHDRSRSCNARRRFHRLLGHPTKASLWSTVLRSGISNCAN
jgi:hypothetical protein